MTDCTQLSKRNSPLPVVILATDVVQLFARTSLITVIVEMEGRGVLDRLLGELTGDHLRSVLASFIEEQGRLQATLLWHDERHSTLTSKAREKCNAASQAHAAIAASLAELGNKVERLRCRPERLPLISLSPLETYTGKCCMLLQQLASYVQAAIAPEEQGGEAVAGEAAAAAAELDRLQAALALAEEAHVDALVARER